MGHVEVNTLSKILVFCGSLVFGCAANALQLGQITSHSQIGEPLNATVGIWLNGADRAAPVRVKVLPDLAYFRDTRLTAFISQIDARIMYNESGYAYIQLSTLAPMSEPAIALRLKVYAQDVALMRNYTLTPNAIAQRPQPQVRSNTPPRRRTSNATQKSTAPLLNGDTYVVRSGDTLWGIANRVSQGGGRATAALVSTIFESNPHAFVNGDRDRLMRGASLVLPGNVGSVTDAPATVAETTKLAQTSKVIESPAPTPSETVPISTEPITSASQPQNNAVAESFEPLREPVDWRTRKPQAAAEMDALEERYAALLKRFAEAKETQATVDESISTPRADNEVLISADNAISETTVEAIPGTPVNSAPLNDGETDQQATGSSFFDWENNSVGLTIVALITGLLLLFGIRELIQVTTSHRAQRNHAELEAQRKTAVTHKAKSRIDMEAGARVSQVVQHDAINTQTDSGIDQGAELEGLDRDERIASNISHGRYIDAEALLLEVIDETPRNQLAKLRLLEVYYMTEKIEEFCNLADDLHVHYRAEIADEDWRRVVRMGKILAPDRTPFSGPQMVDRSPQ